MKHNANVNYKGDLVASSASISSMNAIQAISVAGGSITSGSVVFSTGNGATLGQSMGTITVSMPASAVGAFGFEYPHPLIPFGMSTRQIGAGTGSTDVNALTESGTIFINPIIYGWPLQFNEVLMGISYSTSDGTGSNSERYQVGLYTLNSFSQFSLLSSYQFYVHASQNSITANTFNWFWGTNSTSNSSSSSGSHGAFQDCQFALLSTVSNGFIAAGMYWLGLMYQLTTASSGIGRHRRIAVQLMTHNGGNMGDFCAGVNVQTRLFSTVTAVPRFQFHGSITMSSTGTNTGTYLLNLPNTFAVSLLTNTTDAETGNSVFIANTPFIRFRST